MQKSVHLTQIDLADLRQGVTLETPLYDSRQEQTILLLAEGTVLTASLIDTLSRRGVTKILVATEHVARITRHFDDAPEKLRSNQFRPQEKNRPAHRSLLIGDVPFLFRERKLRENTLSTVHNSSYWHQCHEPASCTFSNSIELEVKELRSSLVRKLGNLYERAEEGDVSTFDESIGLCGQALAQLGKDIDAFVTGCAKTGIYSPSHQGTSCSMLAMAVGSVHGLTRDELFELGVGIMLHEAGMLLVDRGEVELTELLDDLPQLEITKHPSYAADLIGRAKNMPRSSQMVAYQIHERCDGSGYPRRRHDNQIHLLSKIAAVADQFISLTTPRRKFQSLSAYHAMEQILHDAGRHKFDQNVTRSFLYTLSLFPIGSLVELSDGRIGRVSRTNLEHYTRPIVELISPETIFEPSQTINLSNEKDIKIIRPLSDIMIYDERLVGV